MFRILIIAMLLAVTLGCGEDRAPAPQPGAVTPAASQRIVSFCPAMTQIIGDLGRGDRIVAVGAYDPVAPAGCTIVGDFLSVDYERLIGLNPTDIFIQATRQPLPERLAELAKQRGWKLHRWEIETHADVTQLVTGVSGALGIEEAGRTLGKKMETQLAALAKATAAEPVTGTLLVVGRSPITVAGPRTFLSELLVIAGGTNVAPDLNTRYPALDREQLLGLKPACVVLVRPRSGTAVTADESSAPAAVELPVMEGACIVTLDDPASLLPSSSMPRVAAQLARLLHTKLRSQIDAVMNETGEKK